MTIPLNIKYTRRKNSIALKILENQITVLAPIGTARFTINNLIKNKTPWIEAQILNNKAQKLQTNQFYLFGLKKIINYARAKQNYFNLTDKKELVFCYNKKLDSTEIKFLYLKWQQNFARQYILNRCKELINLTKLEPHKIVLKNTITQWGSCSSSKNISLSINLICTKKTVIDYVIIHELCHLKEMNHSAKFWQLVEKFCPNYKTEIKWLKNNNFLIRHDKELNFTL